MNQQLDDNSKRRFCQGLAALLGIGIATSLVAGDAAAQALQYMTKTNRNTQRTKLFNDSQLHSLRLICDTVIPRTDTPSAGDVDCHGFIENQLYHCYDEPSQQGIKAVLQSIEQASKDRFNTSWQALTDEQRYQLLSDLDDNDGTFAEQAKADFKRLKSLIVFGYYTSEVGASQELAYQAVPGYQASVSLKQAPKNWGSIAYY